MNLQSTIDIYAGGPGSGCNPEAGHCGRPSSADAYIDSYRQTFADAAGKFNKAVGDLGIVNSRMKSAASLEEKMVRKGRTDFSQVKDVAGFRVTVPSLKDLNEAVGRLKGQFEVTEEENKLDNPTGGFYRAYHLTAQVDGKPVELQVRTQNQSRLAKWMHDSVYKGSLKNDSVATNYASKLSDALYKIDKGGQGNMPDCPPVMKSNCFSMSMPYA